MQDKRVPLVEPLFHDMVRVCGGESRATRVLLLCLGMALLLTELRSTFLIRQVQSLGKPAINLYWDFLEPPHFFRHEEEPIEPIVDFRHFVRPEEPIEPVVDFRHFVQPEEPIEPVVDFRHFLQPARISEGEIENHDFNLWPRQMPTKLPQHEEGSFDMFLKRDPFKNITRQVDLPAGHYYSRSFTSKSHVGPDGKPVIERYASSAAGNGKEGIHEVKHLYSNSSSGLEKASHEQHLRGRSRMAVSEYGNGMQRKSNYVFHGMNETENSAFDQEFDISAKHLRDRAKLSREDLDESTNPFQDEGRAIDYGNPYEAKRLSFW